MHDLGSDDIYVIVTDMKRQEMEQVTEYFKLMCRYSFGRACKPSMEQKIRYERKSMSSVASITYQTPLLLLRYATDSCSSSTTANSLLPSD